MVKKFVKKKKLPPFIYLYQFFAEILNIYIRNEYWSKCWNISSENTYITNNRWRNNPTLNSKIYKQFISSVIFENLILSGFEKTLTQHAHGNFEVVHLTQSLDIGRILDNGITHFRIFYQILYIQSLSQFWDQK